MSATTARRTRPRGTAPGPGGDSPRRVAVFRKDLLPLSETFIAAQTAACVRWRPTLVGYRRVGGLDLAGLPHRILFDRPGTAEHLRLKAAQYAAVVPAPSRRLARLLRGIGPDLVHAHFGYDAVLVAPTAAALGLPLLVTLHGTDILRDWSAWASGDMGFFFRLYPRAIRRLFARPDVHFVAVSEALAEVARRRGVPSDRLTVAYTGTDTARFDAAAPAPPEPAGPRSPTVLFVGRLVGFKGCETLIRAMRPVRERVPGCRLVVVGDGPLRASLAALAASLGVAAEFTGALDPDAVRAQLSRATLFCLPSITEPDGSFEAFGMVLLEAQAAGVPVLTSAKAGPEAILPGVTGELFPERDPDALAAHILALLADPARRDRYAAAARTHARAAFDIRERTAALEAIYDRVAAARTAREGDGT